MSTPTVTYETTFNFSVMPSISWSSEILALVFQEYATLLCTNAYIVFVENKIMSPYNPYMIMCDIRWTRYDYATDPFGTLSCTLTLHQNKQTSELFYWSITKLPGRGRFKTHTIASYPTYTNKHKRFKHTTLATVLEYFGMENAKELTLLALLEDPSLATNPSGDDMTQHVINSILAA